MLTFTQQWKAARRVSTPLVAIRTFDANSTIQSIRAILKTDVSVIQWDACNGFGALNEEGKKDLIKICNGASPMTLVELPLALIHLAESSVKDAVVFLQNVHMFWENPLVKQGIWNLRDTFKREGNTLNILTGAGAIIPSEIANDILLLDEPLPDAATLRKIVNDTFTFAGLDAPNEETTLKALDALIGLPYFPADQSTAMCLEITKDKDGKLTGDLNITELWERKRQQINQTPGLTVWMGGEKLDDLGGLDSVKKYLKALLEGRDAPRTIIFMDEIEKLFAGSTSDMSGVKQELTGEMLSWMQNKKMAGCILIGVPGAGKSALAKAVGGSYGIPVINFNLAGMQGGIIGSSGANLRAAIATVDAISAGKVLAIGTCNSIGALPPELRARFKDGIFFFDSPDESERVSIWNLYRAKYEIPATDELPDDNGWMGREIEECCSKAYRLRLSLKEAAKYIVPVTTSSKSLIDALREDSSGKYLSASHEGIYNAHNADLQQSIQVVESGNGRRIREE